MKLDLKHRSRRFFWSLRPVRIPAGDSEWVASLLSERELAAFNRMTPRDRAHSIGVARATEANLDRLDPDEDTRWVLQAALLHDVGKADAGLGTYGRVMATLAGWVAGEDMAVVWAQKRGITRRIGLYLMHPVIGQDILRLAGSDPRVSAWAAEHYWGPERWSVPVEVGELLSAADEGSLKASRD